VQEENILLSVASLAGSTIDNRRLLTQIQKRSQQLETSAEVSRVASTILDPGELLPKVVELIREGFNLYYAGIFLVDETGDSTGEPGQWAVLQAGSGEAGQQMVAAGHKLELGGESMIGTSIASSQARIALNVGQEASFFRNPYLPDTRSEMALPLTSRGSVLGALSIQSELEDAFSQEDITALQTMADQLANAIENARLFEQTEIRAEELTVLNEMARGFSQTMIMEELIDNTYQYTGRLMDASNFYVVLYYPEDEFFEFELFVEGSQKVPPPLKRVRLGEGLTDWIIKNKLPVLMSSDTESYLEALGLEARDRLPKSWLGVPMLLGNEVTGVIAVQNYIQENVYNNHSLDLLIAVASQAAVAIDNARRFQATQTRARHEEILRRVTTQVHGTSDPDAILRTAVREVSDALGKPAFVKLAPPDKSESLNRASEPPPEIDLDPYQTPPAAESYPGEPEER
jgi:GAF domain-containing protein